METLIQIPPYYALAAFIALLIAIYNVHKNKQQKLMEFEEARRLEKEKQERNEKKEREKALSEFKIKLDDIRDNFTIRNIESMALSQDEIASINVSYKSAVADIRAMKASPLLNDSALQKSLNKLDEMAGDYQVVLTQKSLCRNNGQNDIAGAQLSEANHIIGKANVEVEEIREIINKM
jgi:hypothetical protein